MSGGIYSRGLDKCAANYAALTPLGFLERAASVYPDRPAVIDGGIENTWSETARRCRQLASALARKGIGKNDTVSVLAPNSRAAYEAHFGVPMAGAVLNAINTRLDAKTIAFILEHGEAKALLVDGECAEVARAALAECRVKPVVIDIDGGASGGGNAGETTYEEFLAGGDAGYAWQPPADEWDAISLNYTSGTTGDPKGVVYHHRGAYLNALSNIVGWQLPHHPVYLWTLPMFHCNGWCFPWSLAAVAGVNVCLRRIDAANIFEAIAARRVTHFCGAPVIMNMLINAGEKERRAFSHEIDMMTAAAPPPAAVLAEMRARGFRVTHVYGLTETYGPAVICAWQPEWSALPDAQQAEKNARQGVRYHALEGLNVLRPDDRMRPAARDGAEIGEAMFRGNIVMKGYLKNPESTARAFAGGWFHSGDLGVMHADNYLQLKDRSKDIIISGGENISSIEIEDCLYRHPEILEAAVVAAPHEKWGETPCAFVTRAPGSKLGEREVMEHCRGNLAHFKTPRAVVFGELPKTSTGKVQKYKLRERAAKLAAKDAAEQAAK
ncbi:MAG: acyl-CoA synthetase [Gammaproteobacteria bacterium]|nr:acyl-CoA synthetase [Gammaproteobacteria bacterium]MDA7994667.1 acyl-CoA synthetase [Gammaproteobacteria bacterium]CAJ2377130.1 MAG: 4-hydroxybutyrate--CoA ligase 2 [Arenicellales bacterium IbO2]